MRSTETMGSLGDQEYVREVGCVKAGLCVRVGRSVFFEDWAYGGGW